jgi:hypothetical protein
MGNFQFAMNKIDGGKGHFLEPCSFIYSQSFRELTNYSSCSDYVPGA